MLVAVTSDIHYVPGEDKHIRHMLAAIAAHCPVLYINAGDDNGSYWGPEASAYIARLEMELLPPETIRAKVPGNHDFWLLHARRGDGWKAIKQQQNAIERAKEQSGFPDAALWQLAVDEMYAAYAACGIHCFNRDGLLKVGRWTFVGHSLWYVEAHPATNDALYLPIGLAGQTNQKLYHEGYNAIWDQMDQLGAGPAGPVAVVSHYPIFGPRYLLDGSLSMPEDDVATPERPTFASALMDLGVKAFINGHMHQQHLGPLRFEAGSNQNIGTREQPQYDFPRYLLLDLKDDGTVTVVKAMSLKKGLRPDY